MFALDPKLAADTVFIAELGLSRLVLMNDRRIPWLILVPRRHGMTEYHHLAAADRVTLGEELHVCSAVLAKLFQPDKLNIGALGNLVSQLHIHVIARFKTDHAWPGPVWGRGQAEPYDETERTAVTARLKTGLEQRT
jgi:diadenosine tetraphosphate (Ap4A) HIT family hydrolase